MTNQLPVLNEVNFHEFVIDSDYVSRKALNRNLLSRFWANALPLSLQA